MEATQKPIHFLVLQDIVLVATPNALHCQIDAGLPLAFAEFGKRDDLWLSRARRGL